MRPAVRAAAVLVFFTAATAVLTYPLSLAPATRAIPLSADTRLFLWTLSWDSHALATRPLQVFDANIFHPEKRTLAYSEHLLGSAVFAAPVLALTNNPVLAMNTVVLLSCVLCGVGGYVLAGRLGLATPGRLAAGIIFAFAPPHFERLAQLHLAAVQWIPFCLAFVHAYASHGRRRDLAAAGGFFTLQSLASGHGGLFLALAGALVFASLAWGRALPAWPRLVRDLAVVGGLVALVNAPFLLPYFRVQREVGLHRTLGAVYDWAPNAASFIAAPTHVQQFLLGLAPPLATAAATAKAYLFPGWLTLGLAAVGLARCRKTLRVYAMLAVLSLWAALGPGFGLYTLLYRMLPGFDLIRVPSRLTLLTLLALAVLAGEGLDKLLGWIAAPARTGLAAAAIVALGAEFAAFPLDAPPYPVEIPAVDRWVAAQGRGPLVELPIADPADAVASARLHSHYMLHSTIHWMPIVNGYSGLTPPRHQELFRQLARFPDADGLAALEDLGVHELVLHKPFYAPPDWDRVTRALAAMGDRIGLEHEAEDGNVYSLKWARDR